MLHGQPQDRRWLGVVLGGQFGQAHVPARGVLDHGSSLVSVSGPSPDAHTTPSLAVAPPMSTDHQATKSLTETWPMTPSRTEKATAVCVKAGYRTPIRKQGRAFSWWVRFQGLGRTAGARGTDGRARRTEKPARGEWTDGLPGRPS